MFRVSCRKNDEMNRNINCSGIKNRLIRENKLNVCKNDDNY